MCLSKYGIKIKKYLKEYYPIKYNEFIVIAGYNNMIASMIEEYVMNKITKIV